LPETQPSSTVPTRTKRASASVKDKDNKGEDTEVLQAYASVNPYQEIYYNTNYPNAMNTLANYTIPTNQLDMIRKVKELREYDIVDYFLRLRCDYGLPIQAVKCSKPSQQKFYDKYVLPLVEDFARQFEYEFWSEAEVFGHYGFTKDKKPMYLVSEDPESIVPNSALGIETYDIKISTTLKQQLKKLKEQGQLDRLPNYLQGAINDTGAIKDKVTLDNRNMARICNQKPNYQLRPKPILLKVAKSLMLREFLIDMDFVSGFSSQKSNFTHVQCGNKDTVSQWNDTKIKAMHDLVTLRPPGDTVVTTRFDVEIKPINMNLADLFDPKKFEECNKRILNFFGISVAYMPSDSGGINNSTVLVSTKPFEESIKSDRKAFEKFINTYFSEINRLNGFSDLPKIVYKTTNIRDSKEFQEELEFFCGKGIYGYEDLCVVMDLDLDSQIKKRKFDWENRDTIAPWIEASQGTQPMLTQKFEQEMKLKEASKVVTEQNDTNNNPDSNLFKNKQANKNKPKNVGDG